MFFFISFYKITMKNGQASLQDIIDALSVVWVCYLFACVFYWMIGLWAIIIGTGINVGVRVLIGITCCTYTIDVYFIRALYVVPFHNR
jgi:hypothetical protein